MNRIKFRTIVILVILSLSLSAQDWEHLGPPGGRVISLSINPVNPSSLYASTYISGLFHSLDSGQSVSMIHHQFGNSHINNITQLGSSTESFICYVFTTGYFKKEDTNDVWIIINDEHSRDVGLTINPKNSNIIYISKNDSELWRSNDGGNTWNKLHTFNEKLRIIEVSLSDTSLIYAAVENAIYKSENSGKDWIETSDPDKYYGRAFKLAINPFKNNSIYLHNEGRLLK